MATHDADIIVAGAGICGTAAARAARAAGYTVLHTAPVQVPHSTAAAAVIRSTYLPPALRGTVPQALRHYGDAVAASGALVTNYRTPDREPRHQDDWHLIDPLAPLAIPDLFACATAAHGLTLETDKGELRARTAVVLATGATSPLSPPGKTTWGVTWIGPKSTLVDPHNLRVHHAAPYKAITAGAAGNLARIGASSGPTPQAAQDSARRLLVSAVRAGLVTDSGDLTPTLGARLQTRETVMRTGDGTWWIGGHHRNGYALAHHDAHRLVRSIAGGRE